MSVLNCTYVIRTFQMYALYKFTHLQILNNFWIPCLHKIKHQRVLQYVTV